MNTRAILVTCAAAGMLAACKLDTIVFSGDALSAYDIKSTVVADSLIRQVNFPSGSETLYGVWLRQPGAASRLTVVFSHGKGENLAGKTEWSHAEDIWQAGFDVLIYDYRGFGRSTGTSTDETTIFADVNAALAFALAQPGVSMANVVSYGHSLGSAPAIELAAANPGLRGLVVESGFESGQAMAQSAAVLDFPVTWLLRGPLDNIGRIPSVHIPALFMHGDADNQIPVGQGRALYAQANNPKQLMIVPGAGHDNVPDKMGIPNYRALLRTFLGAGSP